jgi:acetylornithine deacetylase
MSLPSGSVSRSAFSPTQDLDAAAQELLAALVAIDSVNPSLVEGGAGEEAIAQFIAQWLRDAGLAVELDYAAPGRPSVVGIARGTGGGRSLMLNGHIDTVSVVEMEEPFTPRVEDGRLYGRGAFDMKGGVAACMLAAAHAVDAGLAGDVIVTAVADEEHASIGCQSVLRRWSADACIVTEPTQLRVCVAHKGFAWTRFDIRGRAAHGSRPDLGVDAIAKAASLLAGVSRLDAELGARRHPLLGAGSVHASRISGGQELSSYPGECVLEIERRTLPGETAADVQAEVDELLARARTADPTLDVGAEVTLVRDPFEVDHDAEIVRHVAAEAQRLPGGSAVVIGDHPWMDAALTAAAGIPTVVFGPGGAGAHAAVESGDLASVAHCARALLGTATSFCG